MIFDTKGFSALCFHTKPSVKKTLAANLKYIAVYWRTVYSSGIKTQWRLPSARQQQIQDSAVTLCINVTVVRKQSYNLPVGLTNGSDVLSVSNDIPLWGGRNEGVQRAVMYQSPQMLLAPI